MGYGARKLPELAEECKLHDSEAKMERQVCLS